MREILFRGKAINRPPKGTYRTNYENGDWVYGLVSSDRKYHDTHFTEMTNTDGVSGIDVDRDTICEYTGLVDKNGVRIFEGDIVDVYSYQNGETKHRIGSIGWYDGRFLIYIQNGHNEYLTQGFCNVSEVIGNIFDNPDLLEGESND